MQFGGMAFTKGELLVFQYHDPEKNKNFTLSLVVKNIEGWLHIVSGSFMIFF